MDMDSAVLHQSGGAGDEEEEIGVFTAERYFSGADEVDALWCGRSSSSLSSAFKTGGRQQEYWSAAPTTLTAATTSSEASWNSRSALLRDDPAVAAAAAAAVETEDSSGAGGDRCTPGTNASSPSHNLLLRWLFGVAACACAGGVEEAVNADECRRDEARAAGIAVGGEKRSTEAVDDAALPGRKRTQTDAEAVATTTVSRGMCDGYVFDAGKATPPPLLQLTEPRRIRATDSGEVSARVFNPRATAAALAVDERRRRSLDMFASATRQQSQSPAFTIVAGTSTAARDSGGAGNPEPALLNRARATGAADDDAASDGELLECVYPPSEASVVWSVVTADGVASAGNFSSAASGYYHHYYYHNGGGGAGDGRHTDAGKSSRRSSAGGLLTMGCMSDRALDAISPARVVHRRPPPPEAGDAATWHAAGRK
uniref:Uncharacterized protein n=1 Tax=Oryza punctata TaxID=4537 RepID=A0A0E0KZW2_ORYPU